MEKLKKYWKHLAIAVLSVLVVSIIVEFISWKGSARYARFEIGNAIAKKDSSICDKYWDFEKIVDYQINKSLSEVSDDPFEGLAYAMVVNMRPMLIARLESETKKSIEEDEAPKTNIFKNFWNSYTNKSKESFKKVITINKNKEKFYTCPYELKDCIIFTWERNDKKWKIVGIEYNIPVEEVKKLK